MLSIDPLGADPSYRPKLLLVDDDEVSLMLIAVALRERGFDVVEAGSGDRALQLLTERPTDAVVLDAMMPGRDGFETCRALRALLAFPKKDDVIVPLYPFNWVLFNKFWTWNWKVTVRPLLF